ncbi:hypothetical protein Patl1_36727 [Pistacia atlantica]|nr:hypothetical protein Patl1_36727 [Pistacia atlantica]
MLLIQPMRELGGSGTDGGPELREACFRIPEVEPGVCCPTGEARISPNPEASLRSAYKNSLSLAKVNNIQYIAFPAISCGRYW